MNRKVLDYQSAGCQEVWVLDQENGEIFVHTKNSLRLLRDADMLESALLPGFALPVIQILGQ